MRQKKREEFVGLRGGAKFWHRVGRFFLLPFIHPFITMFLLLVLWLTPTFMGVKPSLVHKWYFKQISEFNVHKIFVPVASNDVPKLNIQVSPARGIEKIEVGDYNSTKNRRAMFQRAKEKQKEISKNVETKKEVLKKEASAPLKELLENKADANLDLNYLENPEILEGKAIVINANKLIIENKDVFLYGIYADPQTEEGQEAEAFLTDLIAGKKIGCEVVAYTKQNVATAYCFVEDVSINEVLVKKGYSKDVALRK